MLADVASPAMTRRSVAASTLRLMSPAWIITARLAGDASSRCASVIYQDGATA